MRRMLAVLFATGLAVLAIEGLAQAKPGEFGGEVTEAAAISGPGLSRPVGLDRAAIATYSDLSNLFSPTSRMHVRPSSVALGPRFDLLLTLACSGPAGLDTVSIHQELYPYASFNGQPQVWTFTPAAERTCSEFVTVAAGWNATRRGLFDTLTVAGLPRIAPVGAPFPLPAHQPERFWPVFGLIAALMTLLLVAALVAGQRRRARVLG